MDACLDMLGIDPASCQRFDASRPLRVDRLTVLETDRFRPSLLTRIPPAFGVPERLEAGRRVFISRAGAERRRLANEDDLWPLFAERGFERIRMEELDFAAQVALMKQTSVLAAPHGAGMTNMVFCPPGATIVEMADPGFPNPNFYALASALGHRYAIVPARSVGGGHPLEKDMRVDPGDIRDVPGAPVNCRRMRGFAAIPFRARRRRQTR